MRKNAQLIFWKLCACGLFFQGLMPSCGNTAQPLADRCPLLFWWQKIELILSTQFSCSSQTFLYQHGVGKYFQNNNTHIYWLLTESFFFCCCWSKRHELFTRKIMFKTSQPHESAQCSFVFWQINVHIAFDWMERRDLHNFAVYGRRIPYQNSWCFPKTFWSVRMVLFFAKKCMPLISPEIIAIVYTCVFRL